MRFAVFSIPFPVLAYATDVDGVVIIIIIGFPPSDKVNAASAPTDAFFILVSIPTLADEFSSDVFFSSSESSLDDDDDDDENLFLLLLVVFLLLAEDDDDECDDSYEHIPRRQLRRLDENADFSSQICEWMMTIELYCWKSVSVLMTGAVVLLLAA